MAYRIATERTSLPIEDGPTVEVWTIGAWPVYRTAVGLASAFLDAKGPAAEMAALQSAYAFFVREAQPTWEIRDHRGPIVPTAEGMLRLPVALSLSIIEAWAETFIPKPSAIDALIPAGPVRNELNANLRRKKVAVDG